MKFKKFLCVAAAFTLALALTACGCSHEWVNATCEEAKICSLCGKTEGEPLGHTWRAADCTTPDTCTVCGATQGEAVGHNWAEATVEAPKTCQTCGATEGEPLSINSGFTESEAYTQMCPAILESLSAYSPTMTYDENVGIVFFHLTAPENTAAALAISPETMKESWDVLTSSMTELSGMTALAFAAEGYEVGCSVLFMSDAEPDTALLTTLNYDIIYNVMDDLTAE